MRKDDDLQAWLDAGQHWLARVQAAGLSCAGQPLLAEGRAWGEQGELLGWGAVCRLLTKVLDEQDALPTRARALLDLAAWVATARRLAAVAGEAKD
ncbi:hypothetical protein [Pseudomonas sp. AN-1]|uniref:hypothetical protein n=1 Tax=Pseudomonas sp. AN-1 TaxID=3096605 RepID=UPI002A6B5ECD|nr:hypothetical protein [Pseudomonas sp. AN-1]WPP47471.1 hypothetical protein SK095_08890 [Pseudomonas sp. AN-1]